MTYPPPTHTSFVFRKAEASYNSYFKRRFERDQKVFFWLWVKIGATLVALLLLPPMRSPTPPTPFTDFAILLSEWGRQAGDRREAAARSPPNMPPKLVTLNVVHTPGPKTARHLKKKMAEGEALTSDARVFTASYRLPEHRSYCLEPRTTHGSNAFGGAGTLARG